MTGGMPKSACRVMIASAKEMLPSSLASQASAQCAAVGTPGGGNRIKRRAITSGIETKLLPLQSPRVKPNTDGGGGGGGATTLSGSIDG